MEENRMMRQTSGRAGHRAIGMMLALLGSGALLGGAATARADLLPPDRRPVPVADPSAPAEPTPPVPLPAAEPAAQPAEPAAQPVAEPSSPRGADNTPAEEPAPGCHVAGTSTGSPAWVAVLGAAWLARRRARAMARPSV
jgi:MYXO-CTERM domain-containing protein